MKLTVQQGSVSHTVDLPDDGTASCSCIFAQVAEHTGIPVRAQKLIYKGKLVEPGKSLSDLKLRGGAKLLLLARGSVTAGQAAAQTASQARAERQPVAHQQHRVAKQRQAAAVVARDSIQVRSAVWQKTGLISLCDCQLDALPAEVCSVIGAVSADCSGNNLAGLPSGFAQLTNLRKLRLCRNNLANAASLGVLQHLHQLTALALSHNKLSALPPLPSHSLVVLDISHNQIASLSPEIGQFTSLQLLSAQNNELVELPAAFGACTALEELNLAHNRIGGLPEELAQLQKLRRLDLDNNRIDSVPPVVLRECVSLGTLSLHGNPLTIEVLRDAEGFAEFDERRRAKYSRQMDLQVMHPTNGFEEGADFVEFRHWGGGRQ